jgi:hypothetical protein
MTSMEQPSPKRKASHVLLWVATGIAALVALAAFILSRPSEGLSALRHDPMSRYVPPGAKQSHRAESDKNLLPIFGSTGFPAIIRRFANCNDACYNQLTIEAKRTGWKNADVSSDEAGFERPATDPNFHLSIILFRKAPSYPTEVSLTMFYYQGPFEARP